MQITKRRLKEIIKEEMEHLAETGDINAITESEKMAFQIILEKLSPAQLKEMGLSRIQEVQQAQDREIKRVEAKIEDLKKKLEKAKKEKDLKSIKKLESDLDAAKKELKGYKPGGSQDDPGMRS